MIGRLSGILIEKQPPGLMIDVQGVGYELEAPMSTFYELPEVGEKITLHTHLAVREDAHTLYGFYHEGDRKLFRTLLKVNGVGAKVALGILSGMNANDFAACVHADDTAALVRLPGIGKKTAERLIIEMRDRLDKIDAVPSVASTSAGVSDRPQTPISDAVSALVALGYKPQEASRMVKAVNTDGLASEAIIREALKGAAN